jgi:predicted Zn-dependent protease
VLLVLAVLAGGGFAAVVAARQVRGAIALRAAEGHLRQSEHTQRRAHLTQARADLARCLDVWPDSGEVHFLAARTARRLGDAGGAARHLDRAEELGWVAEAVDLERALLRAQQGDLGPVEGGLLSFVERDHPDRTLILEALVQGYLGDYQLRRALHCLDLWLQAQPENTQALLWRAEVRRLVGRRDDALADYQRAVELDSEEDEGRAKLAELLLACHQAQRALDHFTRLGERKPGDRAVLLGLARCQAELGRREEAVRLLDELLSAEPGDAAALAERGKLALAEGQPAEAERWLRRSLALAPFERETIYHLYRSLQSQERAREAGELLRRMECIDRDREQLDRLKRAVLSAPHDPGLRCEMGRILLRNGQDREGRRWLEGALRQDPGHAPAHAALADWYERAGDRPRAAYHRQQAARGAGDSARRGTEGQRR